MPDDNLFETEAAAEAAPEGEAAKPTSMTPEDLSTAIQEAMGRGNQPMVQALTDIQTRVRAMEQARAREAGAAAEPPSKTDEAKLDEFLADPDAFIGQRAQMESRKVLERLAPVLKLQLDQSRETNVSERRTAFEREFGEGAWSEVESKVTEQLDRLPLEMQASRTHVEGAVAMALGELMLTPEGRAKMESRRTAAETARRASGSPAMLTGPGRARPQGVEVSQDEKAFVEALQRSGFNYTLKDYVAARSVGNTEEAWTEYFAKRDAETRRASGSR